MLHILVTLRQQRWKDYDEECDKLNKAAEKIKAAGMDTGFHNHEMEFVMLEGKLILRCHDEQVWSQPG